jgi:NitT/TauT family transport system ATP-binding protein
MIEILSASKTYPNGTQALKSIDLTIEEGEFVTLLGPSGCGKSTLLKMIAGLVPVSEGSISLWRKPAQQIESTGHRMSFVFQDATLMPWSRVAGNVRLPLELQGVDSAEADRRVNDVLSLVGLSNFRDAYPRELSGGMQMRASIARGLVTNPTLILMDEPFGALDEIARNKLDQDLLDLWIKKKLTVIFVTHSIYEAVFLSTRVIVMAAQPGRVIEAVPIDEPFPRGPEFRVSTQFAKYAKHLQESLLQASAANEFDGGVT